MAGPTLRVEINPNKCHRCGTAIGGDAILHRAQTGYAFYLCRPCDQTAKHPPAKPPHPEADRFGPLLNQAMSLRLFVEDGAMPEETARRLRAICEQYTGQASSIPALAMVFNPRALLDTFIPRPPSQEWREACVRALGE